MAVSDNQLVTVKGLKSVVDNLPGGGFPEWSEIFKGSVSCQNFIGNRFNAYRQMMATFNQVRFIFVENDYAFPVICDVTKPSSINNPSLWNSDYTGIYGNGKNYNSYSNDLVYIFVSMMINSLGQIVNSTGAYSEDNIFSLYKNEIDLDSLDYASTLSISVIHAR